MDSRLHGLLLPQSLREGQFLHEVMREIEILFPVLEAKADALAKLSSLGAPTVKKTIDRYFTHPGIPGLKTDGSAHVWLRLRTKGDCAYITYKKDFFTDSLWSHSEEHETKVGSLETAKEIIESLGFQEFITLHCEKHLFLTENYEVAFEEVLDLGLFLEIETRHPCTTVEEEKSLLRAFASSLNIALGGELNAGKPELLIAKRRGQ